MKPTKLFRKTVCFCLSTLLLFSLVSCNKPETTSDHESLQVSKNENEDQSIDESVMTTEGKYNVLVSYYEHMVKLSDNTNGNSFNCDFYNGNISWSYRNENSYWQYVDKNNVECIIYDYRGDIASWYERVYNDEGNVVKVTEKSSDGNIKTYVEYKYDEIGNKTEETVFNAAHVVLSKTKYSYNSKGKLTETIKYDGAGVVIDRSEQQYNSDGKETKRIEQPFGEEAKVTQENFYDENGNLKETIIYIKAGSISCFKNKYDADGNIVEIIKYNEDGLEIQNIKQEFDSKRNITKNLVYTNGVFVNHNEWKYNDDGLLIDFIIYNAEGKQATRAKYKHDKNGNVIENINYRYNDITSRVESVYDENNNILEMITYTPDGKVKERRVKTYGKDNIVTSDMFYIEDTLSMGYENKYDSNGNRIDWIDYVNGGKIANRIEWKYDSKGNEIEAVHYDLTASITLRCEKKYNNDGNLTEVIEFDSYDRIINRREYIYDSKKNLIECIYYNASGTVTKRDEYEYEYLDLTEEQYEEYLNILNKYEVREVLEESKDYKFNPPPRD